jgi:hypothetical protein
MRTITITAPGPQGIQGEAGAQGPPGVIPNTGSFATTGSNNFNGNQTITGSLIQGLEGNIATGENSHAEGSITKAIGNYSHAEGDYTQAKGDYSHAEGQETIASGSYSHAEGYQTIALANYQHVQGQWNAASSVPAAFIVGNGTDDNNRSNLIHAAGNEVQITGSLTVSGNLLANNLQDSLAVDGTGVKFPTVDAVNSRSNVDYAKRVLSWFSDFQSFTDLWFSTSAATFTIRPASEIPFRTNQIGVGLLQSGASSSTALFITTANSNFKTLYLGQGRWNYETSILIPVLSIAASRYRIVCGFGDNNGSAFNEADGVFFIYDEGGTTNGNNPSLNWRCITSAGNVRTNSDTIPVVENTWIKLRFEVNDDATEVKFFINDTLVATHTTNIPRIQNSQTLMVKQGMAKTAPGAINTTMWMDYIGYEHYQTTPRT